jgi:hypothetical protein
MVRETKSQEEYDVWVKRECTEVGRQKLEYITVPAIGPDDLATVPHGSGLASFKLGVATKTNTFDE